MSNKHYDFNINIAICDDELPQAEYIKMLAVNWAKKSGNKISIDMFDSAEAFKKAWKAVIEIDILLLDIQMKGQNGIELAKEMRSAGANLQIIFISGFTDYIAEGYDVSALHYLTKPVNEEKFFEVLDKARMNLVQPEKSLLLLTNGETCRIPFSEIRYIEAQGHYIIVKTALNDYKVKMNLTNVEKMLNNSFFRCQRSFIVNLMFVRKIKKTGIVLDNAEEIPLSRDLYEAANQAVIRCFPTT